MDGFYEGNQMTQQKPQPRKPREAYLHRVNDNYLTKEEFVSAMNKDHRTYYSYIHFREVLPDEVTVSAHDWAILKSTIRIPEPYAPEEAIKLMERIERGETK